MAQTPEEAERYYVVMTNDYLEITTDVNLWMIENNQYYCEVARYDTIDDALDALIDAREKVDEEIKKMMN
jgi:hypothetical protein